MRFRIIVVIPQNVSFSSNNSMFDVLVFTGFNFESSNWEIDNKSLFVSDMILLPFNLGKKIVFCELISEM